MASAAHAEPVRPALPSRQEILEWYEGLSRRGHHQILGVASGADRATLRAAFVSLARRFHPDALASDNTDLRGKIQTIFTRITEAYQALVAAAAPLSEGPGLRERSSERTPPATAPRAPAPPIATRPAPAAAPGFRSEPELTAGERQERVEEALRDAETHIIGKDTEAAVSRLHEVLGLADRRQSRRIRLTLARAYAADSRWQSYGVGLLEGVVRDEPWDAEALALLGVLFLRQGLLARAEGLLARAVVADPGNARARSDLREVRVALQRRRAPVPETPKGRGLVARLLSIAR